MIAEHPTFGYEPLGPVFVRGIADPVPIMRVVSAEAPTW